MRVASSSSSSSSADIKRDEPAAVAGAAGLLSAVVDADGFLSANVDADGFLSANVDADGFLSANVDADGFLSAGAAGAGVGRGVGPRTTAAPVGRGAALGLEPAGRGGVVLGVGLDGNFVRGLGRSTFGGGATGTSGNVTCAGGGGFGTMDIRSPSAGASVVGAGGT
jgi:hypothetical protein